MLDRAEQRKEPALVDRGDGKEDWEGIDQKQRTPGSVPTD